MMENPPLDWGEDLREPYVWTTAPATWPATSDDKYWLYNARVRTMRRLDKLCGDIVTAAGRLPVTIRPWNQLEEGTPAWMVWRLEMPEVENGTVLLLPSWQMRDGKGIAWINRPGRYDVYLDGYDAHHWLGESRVLPPTTTGDWDYCENQVFLLPLVAVWARSLLRAYLEAIETDTPSADRLLTTIADPVNLVLRLPPGGAA